MAKQLTYAQLADALHELWLWARDTKAVSPQHLEVLRQASLALDTEWRKQAQTAMASNVDEQQAEGIMAARTTAKG